MLSELLVSIEIAPVPKPDFYSAMLDPTRPCRDNFVTEPRELMRDFDA